MTIYQVLVGDEWRGPMGYSDLSAMLEAGTISPESCIIETEPGRAGIGRLAKDVLTFPQLVRRDGTSGSERPGAEGDRLSAVPKMSALDRLSTSTIISVGIAACAFWGVAVRSRVSAADAVAGALLFPIIGFLFGSVLFAASIVTTRALRKFGRRTRSPADLLRAACLLVALSAFSLGIPALIFRTPRQDVSTRSAYDTLPPNELVQAYRHENPSDLRHDDEITLEYFQTYGMDELMKYPNAVRDYERIIEERRKLTNRGISELRNK